MEIHQRERGGRKLSATFSKTEVPGAPFITLTEHFWPLVFGAPIIYVIPVA